MYYFYVTGPPGHVAQDNWGLFMRFRQCITALSDATREDLGCGPAPRSRTRQSSPIRILL